VQKYSRSSRKKNRNFDWEKAPDIQERVKSILQKLDIDWINGKRIYCFRSYNSKARARARIWGLPRIFQDALEVKPAYVIEVLSEKFDNLSQKEQDKVLIHELSHIPTTFSGSLLPHKRRGKFKFNSKVDKLVGAYFKNNK
jgi:predicted metallopeptidase